MKLRETLKSIILVALVVLMVIQSGQLWLFERGLGDFAESAIASFADRLNLGHLFDDPNRQPGDNFDVTVERLIYPASVSLVDEGAVYSSAFSRDSILRSYVIIMPAIESVLAAGSWQTIQGGDFYETVKEGGVLLDFGREISFSVYSDICGYTFDRVGDFFVRFLALRLVDGAVELIADAGLGELMSCRSDGLAALSEYLAAVESLSDTEGLLKIASLSGDLGSAGISVPKTVVYPRDSGESLRNVKTGNPIVADTLGTEGEFVYNSLVLSGVIRNFGYNPLSLKRDPREEETLVYVENYGNIRVSKDGTLVYRTYGTNMGIDVGAYISVSDPESYSLGEVLLGAYVFLDLVESSVFGGGEGSMRFSHTWYSGEDGALYIAFEYCVDGLRIETEKPAAVLKYQDGFFTYAEIYFRNYHKLDTGVYISDLSRYLAMVNPDTVPTIDQLTLGYSDPGGQDRELIPQYLMYVKE